MLYGEVTVCGGDREKLVNTLCGSNVELLILKLVRTCNMQHGLKSSTSSWFSC